MAFRHDSGSSRRSSQVDPWRQIQIAMFWHVSGSLNGCLPTRQLPQWKRIVAVAKEEGAWKEAEF
eukprot:4727771-Pyramimonas_sp.AAC.1